MTARSGPGQRRDPAAPEVDRAPGAALRPAPRPGASARLAILLAIAIAVVVGVAALAVGAGGPGRQVETGIVVAVQATSLADVQGFSIRTADGRTLDFRIVPRRLESAGTFPPAHLAEHRVSLAPVRVTYVQRDGSNEAVRIEDAE